MPIEMGERLVQPYHTSYWSYKFLISDKFAVWGRWKNNTKIDKQLLIIIKLNSLSTHLMIPTPLGPDNRC